MSSFKGITILNHSVDTGQAFLGPKIRLYKRLNNWELFAACSAYVLTLWAVRVGTFRVEEETVKVLLGCEDGNIDGVAVWRKSLKHQSWQTGQRAKECERQGNLTTFTTDLSKTDAEKRSVNGKQFPTHHFSQRYRDSLRYGADVVLFLTFHNVFCDFKASL